MDDQPIDPYAMNITGEFIVEFSNVIVMKKNKIINEYYNMLTII